MSASCDVATCTAIPEFLASSGGRYNVPVCERHARMFVARASMVGMAHTCTPIQRPAWVRRSLEGTLAAKDLTGR